LNIVFLALGWPPSHPAGSEVMAHELCKALVNAGHRVTVSVSRSVHSRGEYELDGVRVLPFVGKAQDHDRTRDADVIIGHLADGKRAASYGMRYRIPTVVISHNNESLPIGASLVCFNSEWLAADHHYTGPSMIVRPHVPIEQYATTPGDRVTLINTNPAKGVHQVLRIAEAMPEAEFLLVEGTYGGPVVPKRRPNIEFQSVLPPEQMRDRVYARTRVLLMPSVYESWGRTAIEAAASGIPVIAHPTPGLREALGPAGIFIDRDDTAGWIAAIRRLRDGRSWNAASRRARTRAANVHAITTADVAAFVDAVTALGRRPQR
jgi:glycosyltransferase involved in cell wall biosynthesis